MTSPTSTDSSVAPAFGPLAEPIHADAAGPGDPPWRDNAYLCFWGSTESLFGEVTWCTSPNDPGACRVRITVTLDGRQVAFEEPLEPGSFASASIPFQAHGRLDIESPDLAVHLHYTPRYTPIDYSASAIVGGLVSENPLKHYEQAVHVTGTVRVRDHTVSIDGGGFADRSWGYRTESAIWPEYLVIWAAFDDFYFTVLKFLRPEGGIRLDGCLVDARGQQRITAVDYSYDASGLLLDGELTLHDRPGTRRKLTVAHRLGGMFLKMGREPQRENVLWSYDEFVELDAWGSPGRALVAYGVLRHL